MANTQAGGFSAIAMPTFTWHEPAANKPIQVKWLWVIFLWFYTSVAIDDLGYTSFLAAATVVEKPHYLAVGSLPMIGLGFPLVQVNSVAPYGGYAQLD